MDVHESLDPAWVLSHDRRTRTGGYEPRCSCGWHGSLEATPELAIVRTKRHLAAVSHDPGVQPVA